MVLRDKNSKNKPYKNRTFFDSFRYAYQGVCTVFQEERNMRFHVLTTIVVLLVSLFLSLSISEWLWIFLVCFLVIVMEIWNTVIENTIDMFSPDYHPLAKKIKDMAAAAVLFTSIFSVVVGAIILLPKVLVFFHLY
nr:diacylglycerol kinase family protein [Atopostipes suicloacalis]